MRMLLLLCALGALAGCGLQGGGAGRYVVGAPYQVGGLWRYPAEDFSLTDTGIASVVSKGGATSNGESFDAANLAASHRTLEDGQQIVIFGFGALQLPDLIAEFAQLEELIRAGVFGIAPVEDVGQFGGVRGQGYFEPNAKAICTGGFDRFLPRRIG